MPKQNLFDDPSFPATEESIFYSKPLPAKIIWKRPFEIDPNPEFVLDGADRFDVVQGQWLGNCWLLAAMSSLTIHENLFKHVVPVDCNFKDNYEGKFTFKIWQFGLWQEVTVDDRLPTYNNKLVFMSSHSSNEFWSPLLEKAFAKLNGSYEALESGSTSEAMVDLTGGITEVIDLRSNLPSNLFDILVKSFKLSSLMGCSITRDPEDTPETQLINGLVKGHAYSITDVQLVKVNYSSEDSSSSQSVQLLRIRNPWGNQIEWQGDWGDDSTRWDEVDDSEKRKLNLVSKEDGEFWMSLQDFLINFDRLEICHLNPDSAIYDSNIDSSKRHWESTSISGNWKTNVNAGGCRNYIDSFWTNPQFRVKIQDPDEQDDDDTGTIVIGLMQKNMRKRKREGIQLFQIGYMIYKLPENISSNPLDLSFFKYNKSADKSRAFIDEREICGRHKLPPGNYVLVPSTVNPNEECDFLLRVFSENPVSTKEMDTKTAMQEPRNHFKNREITNEEQQQANTLYDAFKKIADQDLEVDAFELRDVLNTAFKKEDRFEEFSVEAMRSMVAMLDNDKSGKLGFDEFSVLWADISLWKAVFKQYDVNSNGILDTQEFKMALAAIGFTVNNKLFIALVKRYSNRSGEILVNDFILCSCRLKKVFNLYKDATKDKHGNAVFNQQEFIPAITYV